MITQKRHRRTKAEIETIRETIHEVLQLYRPMTVRQMFYQLVSRGVIAKLENEYTLTVCRLLLEMRVNRAIPFSWISDNTRWIRKPKSFSSLEAALVNCAATYRRDLWNDQNVYVEVWTEKDALAGVLWEETKIWDVPLMVSRGFSSITFVHNAAENIVAQNKPAYIYYFGDYDPSGLLIDKSIERRLREFAPDADITFERVAVTKRQIKELNLPTRPTKTTGTHSRGFRGRSVEVDAIPPPRLREMVRACVERHVDKRKLEITKIAEQSEKKGLKLLAEIDLRKEGLLDG